MDVDEALEIVDHRVSWASADIVEEALAAEVRDLRAMRARAQHIAEHHPDPSAAGAALQILGEA